MSALKAGLIRALDGARADLALYIAGAEPFVDDRNGRFSLSKAGLAERDKLVFGACRDRGIPVAVTMGGGYSREVNEIVDIHAETIRIGAGYR